MSEAIPARGISRRSFLKTSAVAAGAAAVGGGSTLTAFAANPAPSDGETIYSGACRGNCMGGCPVEITVRDNHVVKVEAWDVSGLQEYKRICQRGRSHPQTMYNAKRLLYPLKRKDGTERGAGEWERISWEEAIDTVCSKWKELQATYGKGSVAVSFASGNYGLAFGQYLGLGYPYRFANAIDATDVVHLYDGASGEFPNRLGVSQATCSHMLWKSKCILSWGSNPTECSVHVWHFIADAIENGAKLINVNPNLTITGSKADLFVPIRPGTDGAFAQTLCNLMIQNDTVDWDEVKFRSTLPALIKEGGGLLHVSDLGGELEEGATDEELVVDADGELKPINSAADPVLEGISEVTLPDGSTVACTTVWDVTKRNVSEWTLAKGSEVCDLPESVIMEAYNDILTRKPATVLYGLGLDHYSNAFTAYGNIALLLTLSGNMSLPGGGMDTYFIPAQSFWGNFLPSLPGFHQSTSPNIPITQIPEIVKYGKIASDAMGWMDGRTMTLKSIFFAYHNFANACDMNAQIEALKALDFVVASDMVETETTKYADIILPCAHWFEQRDVFFLYSPFVTLQEQAVPPAGEAKTNYEIFKALAHGMGVGEYFEQSEEEVMKDFLDSDTLRAFGATWENLQTQKVIPIPFDGSCVSAADGRINYYFAPGGRYTIGQGYGGMWDMGQTIDWDLEGVLKWYPPQEAWNVTAGGYSQSEISKKYPLVYSTYRNKLKTHTQFGWNSWLLELFPEPIVMVCKEEIEKRGLAHGDYVRLFNDRGEVVLKLIENNAIRPGMVVVPKGWYGDFFKKGHYSTLTSRVQRTTCTNNYFFDAVCEMEKYEGSVN